MFCPNPRLGLGDSRGLFLFMGRVSPLSPKCWALSYFISLVLLYGGIPILEEGAIHLAGVPNLAAGGQMSNNLGLRGLPERQRDGPPTCQKHSLSILITWHVPHQPMVRDVLSKWKFVLLMCQRHLLSTLITCHIGKSPIVRYVLFEWNIFYCPRYLKMGLAMGHQIIWHRWSRSELGVPSLRSWQACSSTEQSHHRPILLGPAQINDPGWCKVLSVGSLLDSLWFPLPFTCCHIARRDFAWDSSPYVSSELFCFPHRHPPLISDKGVRSDGKTSSNCNFIMRHYERWQTTPKELRHLIFVSQP